MSNDQRKKLDNLQEIIDYKFKNVDLLKQALTTPLLANEIGTSHYEILETLGDAVIKTILISKIIEENKSNLDPKVITKTKQAIENNETLAKIAKQYFDLKKFIFFGQNQDLEKKDRKILADVLEAICGALYLEDKSLKLVEEKIINKFYGDWHNLMDKTIFYKGQLNEYLQKIYGFNPIIQYEYDEKGLEENRFWIAKNPKILDPNRKVLYNFNNMTSKPFKKQRKAEQYLSQLILERIKKDEAYE